MCSEKSLVLGNDIVICVWVVAVCQVMCFVFRSDICMVCFNAMAISFITHRRGSHSFYYGSSVGCLL
jgi:hypothetical protein